MTYGWNNKAYGILGGAITAPPGASVPFLITAPTSIPDLVVGELMTPVVFTSSGGVGAKTWTCTSGIPAGLSFDDFGDTGVLSGTPTSAGTTTETFRCTDSLSAFVQQPFTVRRVDSVPEQAWPTQDITKGWGMTLNGPTWLADATEYYNALDAAGKADWEYCRIECDWPSFEPTAGSYNYNAVQAKVDWCEARGIRPIIDLTYCPWFYTIQPTKVVTITNVGGLGRLSAASLGDGNYDGMHVRGTGIPANTVVSSSGTSGGTPYHQLNKAVTAGSGVTVTYGGTAAFHNTADQHMYPSPSNMIAAGRAAAALARRFISADPIIEAWNEANGQFWGPAVNPPAYCEFLRNVYRGVKEAEPSVPVAFTGMQVSGGTTLPNQYYRSDLFFEDCCIYMKADATWASWVTSTTANFTSFSRSANTLNSMRLAGEISADFYLDLGGFHAYGFGHTGNSLGADNYQNWLYTGATGPSARFIQNLNVCYQQDPTPGKTGLNTLMWISTESSCPWHPLAVTGRGFTNGGAGRTTATVTNPECASSEEAYVHMTVAKQIVKRVRNYPTGGSMPAKLFSGEPGHRWALITVQKLTETAGATFGGAAKFRYQGQFTDGPGYPGPPAVGTGVRKVAIAADRPRPYLNSGLWSNANIGTGADGPDAFEAQWGA